MGSLVEIIKNDTGKLRTCRLFTHQKQHTYFKNGMIWHNDHPRS